MATISSGDIIFATIIRGGCALLSTRISGIDSFTSLLKHIRATLTNDRHHMPGRLMTINVRNQTQGWSSTSNLIL